jgi:hypothetical protein
MADAKRAAFSQENAALCLARAKDICHGPNFLDGATGAQPAAGDRAALVLPRPFPLSGKHSFVI